MDAPPQHENIEPFLSITHHLQCIGVRVPEIYCHDAETGFILLEDLGDKTFTTLLKAGENEFELYEKGIITQETAIIPEIKSRFGIL